LTQAESGAAFLCPGKSASRLVSRPAQLVMRNGKQRFADFKKASEAAIAIDREFIAKL